MKTEIILFLVLPFSVISGVTCRWYVPTPVPPLPDDHLFEHDPHLDHLIDLALETLKQNPSLEPMTVKPIVEEYLSQDDSKLLLTNIQFLGMNLLKRTGDSRRRKMPNGDIVVRADFVFPNITITLDVIGNIGTYKFNYSIVFDAGPNFPHRAKLEFLLNQDRHLMTSRSLDEHLVFYKKVDKPIITHLQTGPFHEYKYTEGIPQLIMNEKVQVPFLRVQSALASALFEKVFSHKQ